VEYNVRPIICHINTPLRPMAPPWQAILHNCIWWLSKIQPWPPFNNTDKMFVKYSNNLLITYNAYLKILWHPSCLFKLSAKDN
jgi:hypothetical protein